MRVYWVQIVFTAIVLLGHLQFWWLFWSSRGVETWRFFPFLFLLAQPIILYLLAGLCFPDVAAEGPIELRQFYFQQHRLFLALLGSLILLISVRDLFLHPASWSSPGMAVKGGVVVIAAIGMVSRKPLVHAILAGLAILAMTIGLFTFGL